MARLRSAPPLLRPLLRPALVATAMLALAPIASAQSSGGGTGFGLDPRAATPIATMTGISAEYCKRGSKPACEFVAKLQTATTRLVAAQEACARGMRDGCEAVERGVAEVSLVYSRFGRGTGLGSTLPGSEAPARAPGQGPDIFGN